jgi:hypothetical protein
MRRRGCVSRAADACTRRTRPCRCRNGIGCARDCRSATRRAARASGSTTIRRDSVGAREHRAERCPETVHVAIATSLGDPLPSADVVTANLTGASWRVRRRGCLRVRPAARWSERDPCGRRDRVVAAFRAGGRSWERAEDGWVGMACEKIGVNTTIATTFGSNRTDDPRPLDREPPARAGHGGRAQADAGTTAQPPRPADRQSQPAGTRYASAAAGRAAAAGRPHHRDACSRPTMAVR